MRIKLNSRRSQGAEEPNLTFTRSIFELCTRAVSCVIRSVVFEFSPQRDPKRNRRFPSEARRPRRKRDKGRNIVPRDSLDVDRKSCPETVHIKLHAENQNFLLNLKRVIGDQKLGSNLFPPLSLFLLRNDLAAPTVSSLRLPNGKLRLRLGSRWGEKQTRKQQIEYRTRKGQIWLLCSLWTITY